MHEIETLRQYGNKRILLLKPAIDTRSGANKVLSRTGDVGEAVDIPSPEFINLTIAEREIDAGCKFDIVAFDEVQFWDRHSGFFRVVQRLLDDGYDVLASGLALDFRGEPFGSTPDLVLLAREATMWLTSFCMSGLGERP